MSERKSSWRNWGDHPIVVIISIVSAIIGITAFFAAKKDNPINSVDTSSFAQIPRVESKVNLTSGSYKGTCYNKTYNQRGNLTLVVVSESSNKISGNMTITGELIGSGRFEGFSDGEEIAFTSFDPTSGLTIAWTGEVIGQKIRGTYIVSVHPGQKDIIGDQEGTWEVTKTDRFR